MEAHQIYHDVFFQNTSFKVGNSSLVRLWDDIFLGNTSLKVSFSSLYRIARYQDSLIAQNWEGTRGIQFSEEISYTGKLMIYCHSWLQ